MLHVTRSVTINKPRATVFAFWRDLEHLPLFMTHVESVKTMSDRRSHWEVHAPAGQTVEWDAEIVDERPSELLSWRTLEGSDIRHAGAIRFIEAPADRGTEVHVDLRYDAPAGRAGATVAKLFGEEPSQQLRDDLRRLKQVLETGDVVRSDGSLEGAGQGALKQRAAQAPSGEAGQ